LSRMRSPMTSRSNCANDNRTFSRPFNPLGLGVGIHETEFDVLRPILTTPHLRHRVPSASAPRASEERKLLPQPLQTRLIATGAFLGLETELLRGGDDIGEEAGVSLSRIWLR
jgi:hypothetical protein